ncbi:hypothetical protein RhiirA5_430436 [Rhizophagus irregularis]|uniref:Uncharacterized protein n=1 Tax=Rhizophagus irregularis TaxID=588596 RepID=A0A2N0NWP6_9GLOM|nr:hypothetical protein RhiirA5_430436 [Rhizophagus irregularis]
MSLEMVINDEIICPVNNEEENTFRAIITKARRSGRTSSAKVLGEYVPKTDEMYSPDNSAEIDSTSLKVLHGLISWTEENKNIMCKKDYRFTCETY